MSSFFKLKNVAVELMISISLGIFLIISVNAKELNSTNFKIVDPQQGFGGGVQNSNSGNFDLIYSINNSNDARLQSGNYAIGSGFPNGIQASVPIISCLESNTSNVDTVCNDFPNNNGAIGECGGSECTDRAKIEISHQNNPVDTIYLVSVFNSSTNIQYYLQSDHTIATSYDINDYMNLCDIQGIDTRSGSGCQNNLDPEWDATLQSMNIFGLTEGQTYNVSVRALNGDFTEGQFGPVVSVTPGGVTSMSFDIDIAGSSGTSTETPFPYLVSFGQLSTSVQTAANRTWVDLNVDYNQGASLFVSHTGFTNGINSIPSEDEDLSVDSNANGGFGLKIESVTQTAFGPLLGATKYTTSGANEVGNLTNSNQLILSTNGDVQGGRAAIMLKNRITGSTSGGSYSDNILLTLIANL